MKQRLQSLPEVASTSPLSTAACSGSVINAHREQSFQRHSFGEIKEKNTFHVVSKLIHPPTACTHYSVFRSLNTVIEKKHEALIAQ